jgi:rod shape-determining protein MreD
MRWFSFFILAYLILGLQAGVGTAMQWNGARPNRVLLAVIFICMNAPRDLALLASFILGALQDLTSQGTIGLYCFSYGLVGMFIVAVHQAVYREHPLTHVVLALIGGLITAVVLALHGWIHPPPPSRIIITQGPAMASPRPELLPLFISAIYTAILAPLVLGALQRIRSVFQFQSARHRSSLASFR